MLFQIDFKAGKPVYRQLMDQIRYAAAAGALRPGEPLPSIRPLGSGCWSIDCASLLSLGTLCQIEALRS